MGESDEEPTSEGSGWVGIGRGRKIVAAAITCLLVGAIVFATVLDKRAHDDPALPLDPEWLSRVANTQDCDQLQGQRTQVQEGMGVADTHDPDWLRSTQQLDALDARLKELGCEPAY